ncbi:MAG: hypothetical protein M1839_005041 [Geoglossum umbratile]|nr:MAG: hypothetical protein M1839_005041 [Geoglossum umbratile]
MSTQTGESSNAICGIDDDFAVSTIKQKSLSSGELVQQVLEMVKNRDRAELIILGLIKEYSFSYHRLKDLLRENNLEVSFSKVHYSDIAPMVGLEPPMMGRDIPYFPMSRARLTNDLFRKIIEDIDVFTSQYGVLSDHRNEEARSRFLSAYFNRIVDLFSGLVYNTPESLLEGRMTTKGRIEYQFSIYGGITILFIEVKLEIGGATERLNCYAQVIAECDACAWMNTQNGFDIPIMAILCDGKSFRFFKFIRQSRTHNTKPQLFLGQFVGGFEEEPIYEMARGTSPADFIRRSRRLCESLFYVFLDGYNTGLEGYWNRSVEKGKSEGKGRDSTPGWVKAKNLAKEALEEGQVAWNLHNEGKIDESKVSAENALKLLAQSVEEAPWVGKGMRCSKFYTDTIADGY